MITVEKLEKGTYFDDAFKISFRYDPTTVAKVKELAERRYLPEDRAWEIPAHELPALIEKVGLSNIKSEEAVVQALNTKEIEDKREATQERLKGIKPVRDFDFKTAPLPHQIEAFNYGMEKNSLLIGDEQGLGKTKESIDICVARKKELIKTLIVCGVNSVKYNWEKEIQIHSNEGCVMVDGKTMDVRVQQLNDWYRGSSYFGVINIESLRNEKIQDALYLGIKDGYIGAIIVDEIHKAKNGGSQQGKPNVDEIKSLAIKHGADMIVIDQLSLMSDKRRADIPRIAYNNISEDLFLMSKELKKPVLLMAQANREAVKNRKKGESPELHDLAESDGVGQNATRVLSLSVIDGTLKISVKKNRYGINNKEVLMIWEVNTGYLKPLLSENPEESTEDKKDDKPDGEKDKGGEKDYGF